MAGITGHSPNTSVAPTSGTPKSFRTEVAEAVSEELKASSSQTQSRIMTFLTKMGEACSALVEKVREKVAVTTVASTLPSATISITTKVNSALGLFHLASSCILKALPHLGVASGAFSIIDGIRDLFSSRNNHNRAKDDEAALGEANAFLDTPENKKLGAFLDQEENKTPGDSLNEIAAPPARESATGSTVPLSRSNVQAAWTKMREQETLKYKLETQVKTLEFKVETLRVQLDTQALECANIQSTGEGNQRATPAAGYSLLASEEPTVLKDPMTLDLEKTAQTLEATLIEIAELKEEIKNLDARWDATPLQAALALAKANPNPNQNPREIADLEAKIENLEKMNGFIKQINETGLRDVLEMRDLKTTLEASVRVLKEKRLDKAIVGCLSIAVGIVGVVANAVTLGLAAPLVGLIAWGSAQAVKVCLRAYRTATSLTQEDRDSGVMVLKQCYKNVWDAYSKNAPTTDLLGAKLNIMLKLKMPLPRDSEPILIFAAVNDADQKAADNKQRAADETKAFERIDKLMSSTANFIPNYTEDDKLYKKGLAAGKKAALLVA